MTKHQNKIEKLISELCPNGVEFKELGEEIRIKHGKDYKKLGTGTIPVYGSGGIMTYVDTYLYDKPTVLIPRKGSITNLFYTETPFWNVDTIYYTQINTKKIIPKYFYYFMKPVDLESLDTGSGRPSLTMEILNKIKIPLPPLAVQEEIVKILNSFTELETELEAELEARKKQYEHYREEMLSITNDELWMKNGIVCKTLGDICEFRYGFTDKAKDQGNVRFVRITDINENGKLRANDSKYLDSSEANKNYLLEKGDVLMARTGATYGKTMLFNEDYTAVYASFLIRIRFKENTILPAYYWHFAQSGFYWEQAKKLVGGGAQPQFNANVLKLIQIPVPPLAEQERIVTILDKFDALVNDISIGLPAELSARRSQYEYYRGRLLTFKELSLV